MGGSCDGGGGGGGGGGESPRGIRLSGNKSAGLAARVPKTHRQRLTAGQLVVIGRQVRATALDVEMQMRSRGLSRVSAEGDELTLSHSLADTHSNAAVFQMEIAGDRCILMLDEDEVLVQVFAVVIRE